MTGDSGGAGVHSAPAPRRGQLQLVRQTTVVSSFSSCRSTTFTWFFFMVPPLGRPWRPPV